MLQIRSAGQIYSQAHQLTSSSTQKLIYSKNSSTQKTHQLKNSSTQKLIKSKAHLLKSSSTQKPKLLSFILQHHSNFRAVLAKIQAIKQINCHFFYPFAPSDMFNSKKKTCILYHLAFLDWLPTRNFLSPITRFQPLKSHFLTTILPFFAMYFMLLRGFVYTIVAYIYAFRLAFSSILHCIQHHFTLRLASKRTAFSTKMHCIQHQNALRFAAYCTTCCYKQPKSWCKWRLL